MCYNNPISPKYNAELVKNRIVGYNIRHKRNSLQLKVYAMAAAPAAFIQQQKRVHTHDEDTIPGGDEFDYNSYDNDNDMFGYIGEVSNGGGDGDTCDINTLHPGLEKPMSSFPKLLIGLLPGDLHMRFSLKTAPTHACTSLTLTLCTNAYLPVIICYPVILNGNPQ